MMQGALHVINCYLPPSCSQLDEVVWSQVLTLLDLIPCTEPIVLIGDINTHLGDWGPFLALPANSMARHIAHFRVAL